MASAEIRELLDNCSSPEAGCFAGDPDALSSMVFMDDVVIRRDYQRIAAGADDAAAAGIPLEEGVYTKTELHVAGVLGSLHEGETVMIGSILVEPGTNLNNTAGAASRIARCAYVCGQVGVGGCPLKTP